MKQLFILLATCFSLAAFAQKKFDSATYVQYNEKQWEQFDFASFMAPHPEHDLVLEEKIAGLSKCWSEAKYNFANFDLVPSLNWDSLYQIFIPKVMATNTTLEYYQVLQNFYQYLRDGHTGINLPFSYFKDKNAIVPLEVRWIENKAIVIENTSNSKEEQVIKPGMELVAFNGIDLKEYIQKNISPYLHFSTPQDSIDRIYRYELFPGTAGREVNLTFKTVTGVTITKTLKYKSVEKFWDRFPLVSFKVLKGNIGYLQINSFNEQKLVALFDSLYPSIATTKALIIDVRNNGGGNGNNGFEILGCLTDKPFNQGKSAIRHYKPVGRSWGGVETTSIETYDWKPYKKTIYTAPVVVLTSAATYSAAEDFTSVYKSMHRGMVIGEPTGGSTGQPILFSLPGGGMGRVCAKRDFFYDGTEFVGVGIQPDIVVHPTMKGVAAGKDEVLDAAVQYLQTQKAIAVTK
jgi:carboxyl-terminal processing protease